MKNTEQWPDSLTALRARAESVVEPPPKATRSKLAYKFQRELRLHEIELLMQNEELQQRCEEAQDSQGRYLDLFTTAPIAYLVLDAQSRIRRANAAAAALLGVQPWQLLDMKLSSFITADHTEHFVRHMREVLTADGPHQIEANLQLANDQVREVRFESSQDLAQPSEWRTAIVDVTNVRELERALERARNLEAMGLFAASVAHDFGNLLNLISVGLLLVLEVRGLPEAAKSPLLRIQRAVRDGRRMVQQMTQFSASEHASQHEQAFGIDAAIGGVEHELRRLCGEKVALELHLAAQGAVVKLALGAPGEILMNLATNALHALPSGGKLRVETTVSTAPNPSRPVPGQRLAVLRVSDTGHGMDSETKKRALEPFFTTRRGKGGGTGLGLAMVQRIVTRAGGWVELQSEPGRGTTVSIFLPVHA